jgi:hypothetical protein
MWIIIPYLRMIIVSRMEGARDVKGRRTFHFEDFTNLKMHVSVHDKAKNDDFETLFLKSITYSFPNPGILLLHNQFTN